jgi:hypothetical protein
VAQEHPTTRCRDDLVAVEPNHTEGTEAPGRAAAVASTQHLSRILDYRNPILRADVQQRVAIGTVPVEVNSDKCGRQATVTGALLEFVGYKLGRYAPRSRVAVQRGVTDASLYDGCVRYYAELVSGA